MGTVYGAGVLVRLLRPLLSVVAVVAALVAAGCGDRKITDPEETPPVGRADQLPGNPGDLAATAIPNREYVPQAEDFSDTHPEVPGMQISFNTLLLVLQPSATVREANQVLNSVQADIIGGIPGVAGTTSGILFLRLPTTTRRWKRAWPRCARTPR